MSQDEMRIKAEEILSEFDFMDEFLADDGWEYDSSDPDTLVCTVYLRDRDNPDGDSYTARFKVDFRGEKPVGEVY